MVNTLCLRCCEFFHQLPCQNCHLQLCLSHTTPHAKPVTALNTAHHITVQNHILYIYQIKRMAATQPSIWRLELAHDIIHNKDRRESRNVGKLYACKTSSISISMHKDKNLLFSSVTYLTVLLCSLYNLSLATDYQSSPCWGHHLACVYYHCMPDHSVYAGTCRG